MKTAFFTRPGSFSAALLFLICNCSVSAAGIQFEQIPFSGLLQKAEMENKMIFIDCCTSWCPPCRRMEKNVFPDDSVGDFYNSHFICATIDAEKGEGITLAERYEVGCYPTYLFLDAKGNLLHRESGEWPVAEFLAIGKTALSPELRFAPLDLKCITGKASAEEMLRDLKIRKASHMPVDSVLEFYMQAQPDTSFYNRKNWTLIHTYTPPPSNSMFRYLLGHQQEFSEKYTTDSVGMLMDIVYETAMSNCLNYLYGVPDTVMYKKLRTEVLDLNFRFSDDLITYHDMDFYIIAGMPDAFAKTACRFVRLYCDSTSQILGYIIWKFSQQNVTDTACLDTAITWAARSASLQPNYYTARNYSILLYKRGKKKEAKKQATLAIRFADKAGIDATEEKELLRKIRAMK